MRTLVLGLAALIAAAGCALAAPRGAYDIYILDSVEGHHVYAFAAGDRATAARVRDCSGSILDNPQRIVADLRARAAHEDAEDRFNVITIEGGGVHLGRCDEADADHEEEDDDAQDTLIVIEDVSARQARRLINQLEALPAADRTAMLQALDLNRR